MTIDGSVEGSTIQNKQTESSIAASVITVAERSTLTIDGGSYVSESVNATTSTIQIDGHVILRNATVTACDNVGDSTYTYAISISQTGKMQMNDCIVRASCNDAEAYGIYNYGHAVITYGDIRAYSNYTASGNRCTARSNGIRSWGKLELYDCYVHGNHAGITVFGETYIDGGIYESYGHGGIYFSTVTGNAVTHYCYNATIRYCEMAEGYYADSAAGTNLAAAYIGGGGGMDNITVYVDGCTFEAPMQVIILRGSSGEKNNTLYISNSSINLDYTANGVRIDNNTHKLYLGKGNNFTVDDVIKNKDAVIITDEVYDASFLAD